jgi:1,4-dihydroxy-2-naphthoate octaprenyltransferase
VQSGAVSLPEMKRMILIFCLLSLVSGLLLLFISHIPIFSLSFAVLLGLGFMAIYAALSYTIGKNPYGYSGWGDLSVFIFFGLFSVLGTFFLYEKAISLDIFLPAISVGAFSVGVLNLNNMRDYVNDKATGKRTLVVKMGPAKAKYYHVFLLVLPVVNSLAFLLLRQSKWLSYGFLIVIIPMALHVKRIIQIQEPVLFDKELKKLALIALAFSILFGVFVNV